MVGWVFDKDNSSFAYGEMVVQQLAGEEAVDQQSAASKIKNFVPAQGVNEEHYSFVTTRLKDQTTKKEVLCIRAYLKNEENGVIETSVDKLDEALLSFREYGIVFSDDNIRLKLKRRIEQEYMNIKLETIAGTEENNEKEDKLDAFMAGLNEFIHALKEPFNKAGWCCLTVSEFDQLALDCGYLQFEIRNLRKQLKEKGYIHTVGDRYAIMVRYNNKPTRVIAFIKDKIKDHPNITLPEETVTQEK